MKPVVDVDLSHPLLDDLDAGRALPDDLVDAVLNDELAENQSAAVFARLRKDPGAMLDLEETEYTIDALKGSASRAPDFSGKILGEVDRRTGLLSGRGLRRVWLWRGLAIGAVVFATAGVFVAERLAPPETNLTAEPTPLAELVRAVPEERTPGSIYIFSDLDRPQPNQSSPEPDGFDLPNVVRASMVVDQKGPPRGWCPYQNMLPAGGASVLTARWVRLVSQDASTISGCVLSKSVEPENEVVPGFSTLRDRYRPERVASEDDADRGRRILRR